MNRNRNMAGQTVNIVSTGHSALDHRLFDKEARTLKQCFGKVRIIARHDGAKNIDGIEIIPLTGRNSRVYRFLVAPWRVLEKCLKLPADVIHIQDAELLQICPLLKLLTGAKIIYDVHEDFGLLMLRRDWIPKLLRGPTRVLVTFFERLLALSVDGVVGVTKTLGEKFWNRCHVGIYNLPARGVVLAAEEYSKPFSRREYDIVHLGALSQERLEFLSEILIPLISKRPALKVLIIGALPPQQRWTKQHLPPENIDISGKVPYCEMPRLVGNCRIGINVHPWLQEHLKVAVPVKVFEYMACGCNVVSSYLPELAGLLDEQTLKTMPLIKGVVPDVFVEQIDSLLSNQSLMVTNSDFLRKKVLDIYNWQKQGNQLVEFYKRVLSQK